MKKRVIEKLVNAGDCFLDNSRIIAIANHGIPVQIGTVHTDLDIVINSWMESIAFHCIQSTRRQRMAEKQSVDDRRRAIR